MANIPLTLTKDTLARWLLLNLTRELSGFRIRFVEKPDREEVVWFVSHVMMDRLSDELGQSITRADLDRVQETVLAEVRKLVFAIQSNGLDWDSELVFSHVAASHRLQVSDPFWVERKNEEGINLLLETADDILNAKTLLRTSICYSVRPLPGRVVHRERGIRILQERDEMECAASTGEDS